MTWLEVLREIKECGRAAALANEPRDNNPYCYITETGRAYAWEDGYREGREYVAEYGEMAAR